MAAILTVAAKSQCNSLSVIAVSSKFETAMSLFLRQSENSALLTCGLKKSYPHNKEHSRHLLSLKQNTELDIVEDNMQHSREAIELVVTYVCIE